MDMILIVALMLAMIYFFMIRPESKRKKEAQTLRDSLTVGDNITTIGGMTGTICKVDENTVVSSSALKRSYREVLAQNVPTFFVHLTGSQELIQQRLNERKGHFMPPALLPSQFAILEPLQPDENGVEVSIEGSVEEMVERAVAAVNEYAAKVAAQSQQAE